MSALKLKETLNNHLEDPLAGDVDRFVPTEETMTDVERQHTERYPLENWSEESSENYWEEYYELYPEHAEDQGEIGAEDHTPKVKDPAYDKLVDLFSRSVVLASTPEQKRFNAEELAQDRIKEAQDNDESLSRNEAISLAFQDEIERLADEADDRELYPYDYEDEGTETEDPLEGDVDRWVHPDETKDF